MIYDKRLNKYRAQLSYHNTPVHIGLFDTAEEAERAKEVVRMWLDRKHSAPQEITLTHQPLQ
jgi:hypothetical protein